RPGLPPDNMFHTRQLEVVSTTPPPLVPPPIMWEDEAPPSGQAWKVILLVTICLLLLGGLAACTYFAIRFLNKPDTEEDVQHQAKPKKRRPLVMEAVVSARGDTEFRSIMEGLEHLKAGGTLKVRSGVYKESVVLDKPVQVLADGSGTVIVEGSGDPCVVVKVNNGVRLRGFTLRGQSAGALEVSQGQAEVDSCDLSGTGEAVVVVSGAKTAPIFRKCRVHGGKNIGLLFHTGAAGTLEDCEVFGNGAAGIEIRQAANPTLRKCILRAGKGPG